MAEKKETAAATEAVKKAPAKKAAASKPAAEKKAPAAKKPAAEKKETAAKKPAAKKPAAKKAPAKKAAAGITVKLTKSLIGRSVKQIATAKSLGLKKVGDVSVQPDNAATAGKLNTIAHMVSVTKA